MKKISLSFLALAGFLFSFSQTTYYYISGKVIDAATKQPLQSASVFTQNTTFGTTSNAEGNFTLKLPNGGYDLVVTYTGYETESRRITTADGDNKNFVIEIKQKEKSLENVAVVATNEVKDGCEKYGDFFTEILSAKPATADSVL